MTHILRMFFLYHDDRDISTGLRKKGLNAVHERHHLRTYDVIHLYTRQGLKIRTSTLILNSWKRVVCQESKIENTFFPKCSTIIVDVCTVHIVTGGQWTHYSPRRSRVPDVYRRTCGPMMTSTGDLNAWHHAKLLLGSYARQPCSRSERWTRETMNPRRLPLRADTGRYDLRSYISIVCYYAHRPSQRLRGAIPYRHGVYPVGTFQIHAAITIGNRLNGWRRFESRRTVKKKKKTRRPNKN